MVTSLEPEKWLLECFNKAKSPILEEEELRVWWKKDSMHHHHQQLSESLSVLVEEGKLGERSVCVGDSQTKVYWAKNQVSSATTPPAVLTATPTMAARGGKRSRFTSPLVRDSREKRVRLGAASGVENSSSELDHSENGPSSEQMEERKVLLSQLKESKEELRKLKMVKTYRTKTDVQGLDVLTQQWREVCQEAAQSLLDSSTHQPRPSMAQLLDHLHIEPEVIHYSVDDESFY